MAEVMAVRQLHSAMGSLSSDEPHSAANVGGVDSHLSCMSRVRSLKGSGNVCLPPLLVARQHSPGIHMALSKGVEQLED